MREVPERKLTIQGFIFDVVKCCGKDNGSLLARIAKPVDQLLPFYGENAPQRVTYGQITSIQAGRDDIYLPLWDNNTSLLCVTTKIDALWRTMTVCMCDTAFVKKLSYLIFNDANLFHDTFERCSLLIS